MSLNSQIAMINIAICKQDGWSNPCENWVKQVYFFLLYTIFFSNVIYSENITDIDKFHNFKHSKNLKRLPSLVSFLLCVFMKRSQNFYSFSNSKMFTIFFPPEKKNNMVCSSFMNSSFWRSSVHHVALFLFQVINAVVCT